MQKTLYNNLFKLVNPTFQVFFWNTTALALFIFIPNKFVYNFADENKIFSPKGIEMYALFMLSFIIGTLSPPSIALGPKFESFFNLMKKEWKFIAYFSMLLCVIGYIIWYKAILSNFSQVMEIFFLFGTYKTRGLLKNMMIPGVTTLTQLGIIASVMFMLLYFEEKKRKFLLFAIIPLLLSILRVIFFGERLAFIEIFIPIVFIYLRYKPDKLKLFLILGILLFALLWSTELFRSYTSIIYHDKYPPAEYLIYRLSMYFVTTVNNGVLLFGKYQPFSTFFPATLKFYYKMFHFHNEAAFQYKNLLISYANQEYNNKSAWGAIFYDWGYFGIVFSFVLGWISKVFYISYKRKTLWGMLLYPVFLTFLLQSYRILYVTSSRILYDYIIVLLLLFAYIVKTTMIARKHLAKSKV